MTTKGDDVSQEHTMCIQCGYIRSKCLTIIAVFNVHSAFCQFLPSIKPLLFSRKCSPIGTLLKGQAICRPPHPGQLISSHLALCLSFHRSLPDAMLYVTVLIWLLSASFLKNISLPQEHDDSNCVGFTTVVLVPGAVSAIWGVGTKYGRYVNTFGIGYDSIQ